MTIKVRFRLPKSATVPVVGTTISVPTEAGQAWLDLGVITETYWHDTQDVDLVVTLEPGLDICVEDDGTGSIWVMPEPGTCTICTHAPLDGGYGICECECHPALAGQARAIEHIDALEWFATALVVTGGCFVSGIWLDWRCVLRTLRVHYRTDGYAPRTDLVWAQVDRLLGPAANGGSPTDG